MEGMIASPTRGKGERPIFDMDKVTRYNVSMKKIVLALLLTLLAVSPVFAVTAAPHITFFNIG